MVLSLLNGQLHALGEASDPEQLGQLLVSHACLDQNATRALLADYRAARVAPSGGIAMVRIGEVPGDPDGIAVSTTGRLVTVWAGMEWTDLEPEAAERLAALLVRAAELARGA